MSIAMGIYIFGCLLAGFANSIVALVIFRGIAGAGGGGIISVAQIVMSDGVSLRERYVLQCPCGRLLINMIYTQRKIPGYHRWRR